MLSNKLNNNSLYIIQPNLSIIIFTLYKMERELHYGDIEQTIDYKMKVNEELLLLYRHLKMHFNLSS
jgi:hypothetical protein